MNRTKSHQLDHFLNNKTLGSSELIRQLNDYLISILNIKAEIIKTIRLAKIKLGHFESINSYLNKINIIIRKKNESELRDFLVNFPSNDNKKLEAIFDKLHPNLKKVKTVITLSRSGTVSAILKSLHQKNKKIKVVVCESRPKFEGRLMAQALAKAGIKTELITDAMMSIYISKVDAAIIGADVILKKGNVVNKVGSKSLALLCKEHRKPFFVVATKSKLSSSNIFKPSRENPKEVFNKRMKNLSVSNIYFEEVEKKLISKNFTN